MGGCDRGEADVVGLESCGWEAEGKDVKAALDDERFSDDANEVLFGIEVVLALSVVVVGAEVLCRLSADPNDPFGPTGAGEA